MSIMDFVKLQHISGNLQATCIYKAVRIPGLCICPEHSPLADLEALHKQEVKSMVE